MADLFYVQDSRQYVGNDMLWWALGSAGYTTDLRKAQVYTLEEAQSLNNGRYTDVPWPKEYIDGKVRPAVDMQYCKKEEAMLNSGIVLNVPPRQNLGDGYRALADGEIIPKGAQCYAYSFSLRKYKWYDVTSGYVGRKWNAKFDLPIRIKDDIDSLA